MKIVLIAVSLLLAPLAGRAQATRDVPLKWQFRSSAHFELKSTDPDRDSAVLPIAERLLKEDSRTVDWDISFRVRLQVFASLDDYRDLTDEPGWVAASTVDHTIRLQPVAILKKKAILVSTLRHEIFHILIDSRARPDTPLWLHEGLVLFLSGPEGLGARHKPMTAAQIDAALRSARNYADSERAYAAARERVARFVTKYGKEAVLSWLTDGVPPNAANDSAASRDESNGQPRR